MDAFPLRATVIFSAVNRKKLPIHPLRNVFSTRFETAASLNQQFNDNKGRQQNKKRKVIVISGPTGVGKSSLALQLAKRLGGEIISADSVQVYRGLDVGSAKTLLTDRQHIPHHLLDILHPTEEYSAGRFFSDAREVTETVLDKGHVPIVVGGSGLYIRWYVYGMPAIPAASSEITSKIKDELRMIKGNGDWDAAVELLLKAGDSTAINVERNDWYRIQRGLEIIEAARVPRSSFPVPYDIFKEKEASITTVSSFNNIYQEDETAKSSFTHLDYEFLCFFLSVQRTELYKKIDQRCEEMLIGSNGLLAEASWLLDMGILLNTRMASRAIGYRQAMDYLIDCRQAGGESSTEKFFTFLSGFQKASRNFAKQQITWFRNEPLYYWLDASQPLENIVNFIADAYYDSFDASTYESLKMVKSISRKETKDLKQYRSQNRYFVNSIDCASVLNWIRSTQCGRN
ncbi:hypothetical protein SUGI_0788280 [Cryptomeria japonica]|uniref:tRNA dimethylallyltransferase 9 n=1 Tax=Cryptomeria japonica TaxID=3369 RepID=UPI002414A47E|nr:tRNA dimethylallyltransferase 9 [Cryptomeria japonica]GLJ38670.1 hypothetical protein SUGI_0788280 [Cryptomeria japonica]